MQAYFPTLTENAFLNMLLSSLLFCLLVNILALVDNECERKAGSKIFRNWIYSAPG